MNEIDNEHMDHIDQDVPSKKELKKMIEEVDNEELIDSEIDTEKEYE